MTDSNNKAYLKVLLDILLQSILDVESADKISAEQILSELSKIIDSKGKKVIIGEDGQINPSAIPLIEMVIIEISRGAEAEANDLIKKNAEEMKKEGLSAVEKDDLEAFKDYYENEKERIEKLKLILNDLKKNKIKDTSEPKYTFITLLDDSFLSVLDRDLHSIDKADYEIILNNLEKMENVVKSQLDSYGYFKTNEHGAGFHLHGKNTIYKNEQNNKNIRIKVRRIGKDGNIIVVAAISPPAQVHGNQNSEDTRTEIYDAREAQITELFKNLQKKDEKEYEKTIEKLQLLYLKYKDNLKEAIKKKEQAKNSGNLGTLAATSNNQKQRASTMS